MVGSGGRGRSMSMSWQAGRQKKHPTGKVPRYLVGEKAEGARDKYRSMIQR